MIDPDDLASPVEIRRAVREYCIYKISSMLGVGPKVIFSNVYDLVCYNDCIEFYMELCKTIKQSFNELESNLLKNYERDLKLCMSKLHYFKMIHKDIKPENILFSPSRNHFVLTDFGVAHSVSEDHSNKTETYFEGTHHYANEEMKELLETKKQGYVNLYHNDQHALKTTISELATFKNTSSKNYSHNSMSDAFYDSYGEEYDVDCGSEDDGVLGAEGEDPDTDLSYQPPTKHSSNEDFIKFPLEINFYLMKVLYEINNTDEVELTS